MSSSHLKRKRSPYEAYGEPQRDSGKARIAADRFESYRPLAQIHLPAPADPRAGKWRAFGILTAAATTAVGALAAIAYFAGFIAAGILAAAVLSLVAFGNWVLNNTIEL